MDIKKTAKAAGLILVVLLVVKFYANSSMPAAAEVKKYLG